MLRRERADQKADEHFLKILGEWANFRHFATTIMRRSGKRERRKS